MTDVTHHAAGTFCWADLGTTDTAAARAFYCALLGWTAADQESAAGPYTMLSSKGRQVAALYALGGAMAGLAPQWLPYLAVESADEAARAARAAGATVQGEPFDVETVGRMVLLQDPEGARFALWEARAHIGASAVGEPGALCWNELSSTDVPRCERFYVDAFGWTASDERIDGAPYALFEHDGRPVAGMMPLPDDWSGEGSHWLVYFGAHDADATVREAERLGGRVVVPPTDVPDVGRFAVLRDPQGAKFAVITIVR
jgi:predicted enzyme related to lactoylglutathione lyase